MTTKAIEIKNFSFSYGDKRVLKGIDLSIDQGEYVSFIGPNGAGKSTILKCLNRILSGGEGTISILGKDLHAFSQKEIGRWVGYVPQNREQVFPYTVQEFVWMGRYPYQSPWRRPTREDEKSVEEAVALTGLINFRNRRMDTLSGGERQKVYIAGALAQQPKILFLDEPTTHLDPKHMVDIQHTITQICSNLGITVLHVTHDLNHIISFSHRIVGFKECRIVFDGKPQDVMTKENLNQLFDTHFLLLHHSASPQPIIVPEVRS